jgi:uncharacterized membrane protein
VGALVAIEEPRVKRIGAIHLTLNLAVVALCGVNLWLRVSALPGKMLPVGLSVLAVLMLGVSGWLGGEMVYVHGVSVEPQHDSPAQERAKIRVA